MPVIEDNEKIAFDAGDQSGRIEFSLSDRSLSIIPLLPYPVPEFVTNKGASLKAALRAPKASYFRSLD